MVNKLKTLLKDMGCSAGLSLEEWKRDEKEWLDRDLPRLILEVSHNLPGIAEAESENKNTCL
jgi:hypothetical protein